MSRLSEWMQRLKQEESRLGNRNWRFGRNAEIVIDLIGSIASVFLLITTFYIAMHGKDHSMLMSLYLGGATGTFIITSINCINRFLKRVSSTNTFRTRD